MNRKLLSVNVVLAATVVYAGFQFHNQRGAAKAREAAMLGVKVAPAPPPPIAASPAPPATVPANYQDVATRTLFNESRNPNVDVTPPAPPPKPPDPPPLPSYFGQMNIGDGPIAIMSAGGRQMSVPLGGTIGDFKLVDFNRKEIALEWNGTVIRKRLDELGHSDSGAGQAAAPTAGAGRGMPGVASAPLTPPKTQDLGPGSETGATHRACQPGDSNQPGTVVDGYKKVQIPGPFGGGTCYWESVGK